MSESSGTFDEDFSARSLGNSLKNKYFKSLQRIQIMLLTQKLKILIYLLSGVIRGFDYTCGRGKGCVGGPVETCTATSLSPHLQHLPERKKFKYSSFLF